MNSVNDALILTHALKWWFANLWYSAKSMKCQARRIRESQQWFADRCTGSSLQLSFVYVRLSSSEVFKFPHTCKTIPHFNWSALIDVSPECWLHFCRLQTKNRFWFRDRMIASHNEHVSRKSALQSKMKVWRLSPEICTQLRSSLVIWSLLWKKIILMCECAFVHHLLVRSSRVSRQFSDHIS